jgi:hypothetical protein
LIAAAIVRGRWQPARFADLFTPDLSSPPVDQTISAACRALSRLIVE